MPKRKVTGRSAAQRVAQKKAARASALKRKKGARPHGKTLSLYHFTSAADAGKIVKSGFKPVNRRGSYPDKAWFMTLRAAKQQVIDARMDMRDHGRTQYGTSAVRVRVPYKKTVAKDRKAGEGQVYTVPFKALKGIKIKREL